VHLLEAIPQPPSEQGDGRVAIVVTQPPCNRTLPTLLTLVFTAVAMLVSLLVGDRARGLGLAILLWLAATALYDALIVLVATTFSDYPLELPLIALTILNPVDLGRVLLLLRLDTAALMGYTGAVFERFFGSLLGTALSAGALLLWCVGPLGAAHYRFCRKDF
jgi:Cu-processing system permease protein